MPKYRRNRINDSVKEEMAVILRDIKDPRVSDAMITVTNAEVTADMKYAKIFYSVFGEYDSKEVKNGLKSAAGYVRRRLAESLNLRITPEVSFYEDEGVRHGAEIAAILKEISPAGSNGEAEDADE